jgi:hypothetical protein
MYQKRYVGAMARRWHFSSLKARINHQEREQGRKFPPLYKFAAGLVETCRDSAPAGAPYGSPALARPSAMR